jgi:hypothetical protein
MSIGETPPASCRLAPCALPATTTGIVAKLWTDADWSVDVTQEFAGPYTFVARLAVRE